MNPSDDPIEIWGKRIGRGIAFAAVPFLLYFIGRDLGWW
jgi:hypothetical protein